MWSFYSFHFDKNNSFTGSALQTSHNITTPIVNTFLKLLFPMKKKCITVDIALLSEKSI